MSSELEWRWADPQGQQRLVRIDELRAALAGGVIAPNTPVWRSGWGSWKPAYEVPELTSVASANGAVLNIPPPPLFIVAVQHEYEDHGVPPEPPASHNEPPPPPRYVPSAAPPVAVRSPVAASAADASPAPDRASPSPKPAAVAPSPTPAPVAQNQVALFKAVPAVTSPPVKASVSTDRLKAALPQPATLGGFPDLASPPSSLPHSASPPQVDAGTQEAPERHPLPSAFPPADSSWDLADDKDDEDDKGGKPAMVAAIPPPAPSETLAGARPFAPVGMEANTAVDIAKLTAADAERILAGGPSHATVIGVPVLAQPDVSPAVLPPPPPFRPPSVPPTLAQAGVRLRTPHFGSVAVTPKTTPRPPPIRSTRPPPPLRKRGHTLLLYGGAPQQSDAHDAQPSDAPPINVPAPGAQAPKAVTQAPPWLGESKVDSGVPRLSQPAVPDIRPMMDSIEEISGSVILAEDSGADVTARRQKIEDLSGSHLLADASGPAPQVPAMALPPPEGPSGTMHAEPAPAAPPGYTPDPHVPVGFSSSEPGTKPSPGMTAGEDPARDPFAPPSPAVRIVHNLNEIWKQPRQRRMLAMGAGGAFVLLSLFVLIIRLATGSRATPAGPSAVNVVAYQPPSAGSAGATSPVPADPATALVPAAAVPPSTTPCALAGSAHVVAPKAQVRTGVETVASQNRLALGFVTAEKDGLAVLLDPGSLTAVSTAKQHSHEPIRRLVPQLGAGKSVVAVADADRKWERIAGARTVPGEGSFVLGTMEGKLAWGARSSDTPHPLWALEGDGPVEALRAVQLDDGGHVVAFRQGTAIYVGTLGVDKVPVGGLSRIAGLGPQIGSPALAASGSTAMVVFADRAAASDPWMLRFVRWHAGQAAGEAETFAIPPGGMGEQAMSPGVTGVAGSRFLLAWTEGPVSSHQVRVQTLTTSGEALGAPVTISGDGVNAGQGQLAILPDGRGLVAYMASPTGATAQVVATPVACPLSGP